MGEKAASKWSLQGRVILSKATGDMEDVTEKDDFGFKYLAELGGYSIQHLEEFRNRLGLLKAAAGGGDALEVAHVLVVVNDLLNELDDEGELPWFVKRMVELLENAEPLPPLIKPYPGNRHSLQLVTHGKASQKDAEIEGVAG